MIFISPQWLFTFSRYLIFCFHFLVIQKKTALLETLGYFKINNITTWLTNNQNTHIAQYLTKQRQSDNDI